MKIVGFWFPTSKLDKNKLDIFANKYESEDLMFKQLDLDVPIENQGSFDLIAHFGIELNCAARTEEKSKQRFENLQDFMRRHPEVIYVDDMDRMLALNNREAMMKKCAEAMNDPPIKDRCFMPNYVVIQEKLSRDELLSTFKKHEIRFPVVCKPTHAYGVEGCHQMMILLNEDNLSELEVPCIVQNFHNHSAQLNKLYIMGPKVFVLSRGSVKNLEAGAGDPIRFHTFDVSKLDSKSLLSKMDESNDNENCPVDQELLMKIGARCRKVTGLEIMSADVIRDSVSKKYALLDINCFPGFQGVDFCQFFEPYVRQRLNLPVKEHKS